MWEVGFEVRREAKMATRKEAAELESTPLVDG
jgi:hypothetical protein